MASVATSVSGREVVFPRRSGRKLTELALWLTEEEAEALASLCLVSPAEAGEGEQVLFGKLGELLRAFRTGSEEA